MKHLYPLLLIAFLLPGFSQAQSNYKPGYVVTQRGDTVRGFVDYGEWDKNPSKINFKKTLNANKERYSVAEASAFAINGFETYRRFIIWLSQDQVELSNLSSGKDTTKMLDTVFLKELNTGKNITLYAYTDKIKQRLFISDNGATPVELTYHEYIDPSNSPNILIDHAYKHQLQMLAVEYNLSNEALINEIQNTDYKDYAISKIVNKINGITNMKPASDGTGIRFFAGAGINSSSINVTGSSELSNAKSSSQVFPKIDIGADIYLNKNVGRLIFRTELYYTGNNTQFIYNYNGGSYTGSGSVINYSEVLKFNTSRIGLEPQIIYNIYNSNNLKFYLDVGVAFIYCDYTNKVYNLTISYTTGGASDLIAQPFPYMHAIIFNVPAKIGFLINNRFNIYAGYMAQTALNENNYSLNLTQYELGINYIFGK